MAFSDLEELFASVVICFPSAKGKFIPICFGTHALARLGGNPGMTQCAAFLQVLQRLLQHSVLV